MTLEGMKKLINHDFQHYMKTQRKDRKDRQNLQKQCLTTNVLSSPILLQLNKEMRGSFSKMRLTWLARLDSKVNIEIMFIMLATKVNKYSHIEQQHNHQGILNSLIPILDKSTLSHELMWRKTVSRGQILLHQVKNYIETPKSAGKDLKIKLLNTEYMKRRG